MWMKNSIDTIGNRTRVLPACSAVAERAAVYIYSFDLSRCIHLRLQNVSDISCKGNQNIHFMFSNTPPPPRNCAVYEIMWKSIVEQGRPQMTVRCMHAACWITKATRTHSEYVVLLFYYIKWVHECTSILGCTYITCFGSALCRYVFD
jgi:hypothetical protein